MNNNESVNNTELLLEHIANLSHCGWLADMNEHETLVAIRKLTVKYFNPTGTEEQLRQRVISALSE